MADEQVLENNIYKASIRDIDHVLTNELANDTKEWLYWSGIDVNKLENIVMLVLEINGADVFALAEYDLIYNVSGLKLGSLSFSSYVYISITSHISKQNHLVYLIEDITIADEKDT